MSDRDYRHILSSGRKAGLNTAELYRALSIRQPPVGDRPSGRLDSNGFIGLVQSNGRRDYQSPPRR